MKAKMMFITGLVLALVAAGALFHGHLFGESNSAVASVMGIIGVALIATSKFRLL
jgi:hypothetical protein